MTDWQSNAVAVGTLGSLLVAMVAFTVSVTKRISREERVHAVINTVLLFAMIVAIIALPRWGLVAVMGLQAVSVSVFFMWKPQLSRMDFILLAVGWSLFFSALFAL